MRVLINSRLNQWPGGNAMGMPGPGQYEHVHGLAGDVFAMHAVLPDEGWLDAEGARVWEE